MYPPSDEAQGGQYLTTSQFLGATLGLLGTYVGSSDVVNLATNQRVKVPKVSESQQSS